MSLRPLSNIFSSCNPGINHSAILSSHKQPTPFSELSFLLQINHELPDSSELFRPGGGRSQVPGQHASVGLLPLPLSGLLFRPQTCGSAGCGPLFPQIGRGEARECRSTSGKHEAIAEATSSFWTGGSVSREVGKIQEALEAALLMTLQHNLNFQLPLPSWMQDSLSSQIWHILGCSQGNSSRADLLIRYKLPTSVGSSKNQESSRKT